MMDRSLEGGKKEFLERNPVLIRWFGNMEKKSDLTSDIDLRKLVFFSKKMGKIPAEFAPRTMSRWRMLRPTSYRSKTSPTPATDRKYSPKYLAGYLNPIKPWAEIEQEET